MKAKPNSQKKVRFTDQNQNNSIEASQPTKSQKEEELYFRNERKNT